MRIKAEMGLVSGIMSREYARVEIAVQQSVAEATEGLKIELRRQVMAVGLGRKLANSWRSNVYPKTGVSAAAAGLVWSRAPDIISSYEDGATIYPVGGRKYLWVPAKAVPRTRGGKDTGWRKMTPAEVEEKLGQLIIRRGKGQQMMAFIRKERGLTKNGGLRKVRKGRRGIDESGELVLMFNLLPTTRRAKKLDIDGAANRWGSTIPVAIARRLDGR